MGLLSSSFDSVPVNSLFGFKLQRHDEKSATVTFNPDRLHTQEYGVVHGGILSCLADTAAVYTTHPFLAKTERMTSIEFKINFLAAAVPDRGEIMADAVVIRKGKTVAVVRVDVRQADVLVATGLFTYIVLQSTSARS